jgi:hypothetical protein
LEFYLVSCFHQLKVIFWLFHAQKSNSNQLFLEVVFLYSTLIQASIDIPPPPATHPTPCLPFYHTLTAGGAGLEAFPFPIGC